jgi:hypothetical protein
MSDRELIAAANALIDGDRAEAWRYPTVWEPLVDRLKIAAQAPQPVVPAQWRVVMRGMVEYAECNDPGNPYLPQAQALLSAGKGE